MWTNVAKPTTNNWLNTNPKGRAQYDDASITFDDMNAFYDAVDVNSWTNVAKPNTRYTIDSLHVPINSLHRTIDSPTWTVIDKPL